VPFLRLTRDRRGTENTFLMHADRPGDRPRLLYWYRTAPGIALGRLPLDEDAIRLIEEQHPDIEFDWPAILALSEVMTPEDEAPAKPQAREQQRRERKPKRESFSSSDSPSASASAGEPPRQLRQDDRVAEPADAVESADAAEPANRAEVEAPAAAEPRAQQSNLVDQLAGREIASRLRGRYEEITMRIRGADAAVREGLMKRAEALDPDRWDTPEAVLQGVSNADALFETLRAAVAPKP
jgi:hypothetical protein